MSKVESIEINFPRAVELPDGWEQALDGFIAIVCRKYEQENPDRVMWVAGVGSKTLWREPEEPQFDDSILCFDVYEREDLHGRNKHNPDRDRLREQVRRSREAKKKRQHAKFD